ncbi:MAG TPA: sulfate ABC transporter substrate-binding protein [bacterium]|nr:sulfate ABC transporter substrate-binding protein [bacterium]
MKQALVFFLILSIGLLLMSCGKHETQHGITLTLGAYTVPKEVYQKEIIPAFQKYWFEKTGQVVNFNESYIASGAQSRAILAGFEADIAALSLEKDVDRLNQAGLITHDWKANEYKGFVTRSIVVIGVRPGNPKNIKSWEDLAKPGVSVLYPSPKTSGGAMWFVNAIYGAGLKYSELITGSPDPNYAKQLLKSIQRNVKVMDKSGRASVTTFENGVGDAIATYENEIILRQMQGRDFPYIIPDATILIENPIAIIDKNVEKHNNREVAEAFVKFVFTKEVQRVFSKYGFRAVDVEVEQEFEEQYPLPDHLFDIGYVGGWEAVHQYIYGTTGIWSQIMKELAHE